MRSRRSDAWRLALGLAVLVGVGLASDGGAYLNYSESKTGSPPTPTGNCVTCHGGFQASPYLRLGVDQGWGTDLMTGHTRVITDCFSCHNGPSFYPVPTILSSGTFKMSCLGCHGRFETGPPVNGSTESSGLRQRHWSAGITLCGSCHPADSDPASFVPVGEWVLPPNYDVTLSVVSLTDPCNPGGVGESFAGAGEGLDNDGDGLYDGADPDCAPPSGTVLIQTSKLVMKDNATRPKKRRIRFSSKTRRDAEANQNVPPPRGSGGDPTLAGGTVTVRNASGGPDDVSVALPAAGWTTIGSESRPKGFRYRSASKSAAITRVWIKDDVIVVRGGGSDWDYTLDESMQGSVAVELTLGAGPTAATWCAEADEPRRDRTDRFVAKRVPAPGSCPLPVEE